MNSTNQQNQQPKVTIEQAPDYREAYSNSVQIRVSVWDFFLAFGIAQPDSAESLTIRHSQGIYLSPQQAKALWNLLGQNLAQYEQAFGNITLEPQASNFPPGPVH